MGVCLLTCFYLMSLLTIASLTHIANVDALKMQGEHSTIIWFLGLLHAHVYVTLWGALIQFILNCKEGVEINNVIFVIL